MLLHLAAAAGGDHVIAGDVLDWITTKETALAALVPNLLWLVAAFTALVAWVTSRSWKKAMVAGIGGGIVIAVVGQMANISDKVKTEIDGAPAPAPAPVVRVVDQPIDILPVLA